MNDPTGDDTEGPSEPPALPTPAAPGSGGRIGRYRLLEKLGEGGMGEVWLAEQTEPVRRKVALKVIKQGMDTKQVIARFEAERQALAMMDHPAIAKVYDAGATPEGRPYFAMEHVPGVPFTEHCDRHRLTNRERLILFVQVCEGVQHAHQKAVIHRDLKPSNVLVSIRDDKPVPKIIDFGVAKATGHRLTEQTLHTQLGVMIGTPAYMSPEQADLTAQDVDTRTDVYSLGVMLYELLAGALPFDPKEIREDEPPRPSTRVSTLGEASTESARARRTDLGSLRRELRGDLDWITLKAMEKDRTRRYSSPQDLAADIRRYLGNEPVLASPPSAAYRARKFGRRHAWGVGAAAAGVLVLVVFAATMAVQAKRIASERDAARQAQADLESVVTFQAGMLGSTDPQAMGRRLMQNIANRVAELRRKGAQSEEHVAATTASLHALIDGVNATDVALDMVDEDILGRAVATLDKEFSDRPRIDARLRNTIGLTYWKLGRYERAETQLAKALEIDRRVIGPDHPDTLKSMNSLAGLYTDEGRYADAERLFGAILEARKRAQGADHPDTLGSMNNLAKLYADQGRYAEAEPLYLAILEARTRTLGADHPLTLNVMNNLGALYVAQGRYADAEPLYVGTLEGRRRVLGADHPHTLDSTNNLGVLYWNRGRYAEAEPLYVATLEARKRVHGADHPDTLGSMNNLAGLYSSLGRDADAEQLYLEALEAEKRVLGEEHPTTLITMNNLGGLCTKLGEYGRAATLLDASFDARVRVLGKSHPHVGYSHYNLGCLDAAQGRRKEALDHLRDAVALGWQERDIFHDAALEPLRGDPEFEAIVARVKKQIGDGS